MSTLLDAIYLFEHWKLMLHLSFVIKISIMDLRAELQCSLLSESKMGTKFYRFPIENCPLLRHRMFLRGDFIKSINNENNDLVTML